MRYYLAYGSNMVIEQMNIRCPESKFIKTEKLYGYELIFKRTREGVYLDLIKSDKKNYVPVVIWEISENDEKNLDEYEDVPLSYLKKEIDCSIGKALVYIMANKWTKEEIPEDKYFLPILKTYEENKFDENILIKNLGGI
ncbi:gamma-glutamylcyclotransferase family protein [Oceanivirga salmonicida]|uniref:gamma-glutamylcyclotransferase family protein n=1 Tax=Oceanivirga salmonicida TaxID=1769291 RepID=UPI0008321A87|nr:gamma-glutamylcyclotransferase family protein [Oceanivirga salmonicida]